MYQVGDYIVKSASGVCQIRDIVNPDFVKENQRLYYQLIPLADRHAKLYMPVDKADDTMRAVMNAEEVEVFIKRIP